jgi:Inorganic pyrophosphatase
VNKNLNIIYTILLFINCDISKKEKNPEFIIPTQYKAVIEIPAGTNKKFEYNYKTKNFECKTNNNEERIINYLPYPGNYGFIKNTYMTKKKVVMES